MSSRAELTASSALAGGKAWAADGIASETDIPNTARLAASRITTFYARRRPIAPSGSSTRGSSTAPPQPAPLAVFGIRLLQPALDLRIELLDCGHPHVVHVQLPQLLHLAEPRAPQPDRKDEV